MPEVVLQSPIILRRWWYLVHGRRLIGTKLFSVPRFKFLRDLVNGYAFFQVVLSPDQELKLVL